MKAIRVHELGNPEVMKLEEIPEPKAGPEQVLVRVRAAGRILKALAQRRGAQVH